MLEIVGFSISREWNRRTGKIKAALVLTNNRLDHIGVFQALRII